MIIDRQSYTPSVVQRRSPQSPDNSNPNRYPYTKAILERIFRGTESGLLLMEEAKITTCIVSND